MKRKMILFLGAAALALGLVGTPASWAGSLTFQGVDFILTDNLDGSTFNLEINNVESAIGNWTGIDYLSAFSLKNTGAITYVSVTPGSWSESSFELNGNGDGCPGPGGGGSNTCFTSSLNPYKLDDDNLFTITYNGTLDLTAPHLKVAFQLTSDQVGATGDLLSKDITSVPEPVSLLLLGAGLAGLGIWRRQANKV